MQFECAYKMVNELQKKYFKYKTTMYNAIMAGYFFQVSLLDCALTQIFNYESFSLLMISFIKKYI